MWLIKTQCSEAARRAIQLWLFLFTFPTNRFMVFFSIINAICLFSHRECLHARKWRRRRHASKMRCITVQSYGRVCGERRHKKHTLRSVCAWTSTSIVAEDEERKYFGIFFSDCFQQSLALQYCGRIVLCVPHICRTPEHCLPVRFPVLFDALLRSHFLPVVRTNGAHFLLVFSCGIQTRKCVCCDFIHQTMRAPVQWLHEHEDVQSFWLWCGFLERFGRFVHLFQ